MRSVIAQAIAQIITAYVGVPTTLACGVNNMQHAGNGNIIAQQPTQSIYKQLPTSGVKPVVNVCRPRCKGQFLSAARVGVNQLDCFNQLLGLTHCLPCLSFLYYNAGGAL
jgi:hypothetical protein